MEVPHKDSLLDWQEDDVTLYKTKKLEELAENEMNKAMSAPLGARDSHIDRSVGIRLAIMLLQEE